MKITVDIPKELMDEAMELTAAQTKSQLIQEALVAQIARIKKRRLLTLKGTIDLDIDLDVLRDRRDAKA